ncbi:hypothetical protein [Tumidithrix helvetica]|uniref:hypothetical protein n=1 Tax=Tumidithrix helvetica TaxID=3457545 RepID=UPI003CC58478
MGLYQFLLKLRQIGVCVPRGARSFQKDALHHFLKMGLLQSKAIATLKWRSLEMLRKHRYIQLSIGKSN